MNFWNSLSGVYRVQISGASIADTLTAIERSGISLFDVQYLDELTVRAGVLTFGYNRLKRLLEKRGDAIEIIVRSGLFWTLRSLNRRPVLLLGVFVFVYLALFLPTKVLFVRVEGNTSIPTKAIIEKAEKCGIMFGTSRRQVRSEKVKNKLLASMPELTWAGINTYGCVAVISVQEKNVTEQKTGKNGIASIIAREDGIITQMNVLRGTPLFREGQAVTKGQVLVSGYTDCGLSIRAEVADAEVIGLTRHNLHIITPSENNKTDEIYPIDRNVYLKIGKKLIKFSKDSGISSATCVKMYNENYLLLPGGFRLPVSLITEDLFSRTFETEIASKELSYSRLKEYSKTYLTSHMVAGEILESNYVELNKDDRFTLIGNFACLEMIGQIRYEEIIDGNGKRN